MIHIELAMNDRCIRELDSVVCEREARAVTELHGQVRVRVDERLLIAGDPCWEDEILGFLQGFLFLRSELGRLLLYSASGERIEIEALGARPDGLEIHRAGGACVTTTELARAAADAALELAQTLESRWAWGKLFPVVARLDDLGISLGEMGSDAATAVESDETRALHRVGN